MRQQDLLAIHDHMRTIGERSRCVVMFEVCHDGGMNQSHAIAVETGGDLLLIARGMQDLCNRLITVTPNRPIPTPPSTPLRPVS